MGDFRIATLEAQVGRLTGQVEEFQSLVMRLTEGARRTNALLEEARLRIAALERAPFSTEQG